MPRNSLFGQRRTSQFSYHNIGAHNKDYVKLNEIIHIYHYVTSITENTTRETTTSDRGGLG